MRGLLVAAFLALPGGTLAVPRPASPVAQSAATPSSPPTVRPAPSVMIAGDGAGRVAASASHPTATPLPAPAEPAPAPTPPDWDALAVPIEEAWAREDWPATEAAILHALEAFPQDTELRDKLFAARISRADGLVEAGQRAEAARVYASARDVRPDPLVEAWLARQGGPASSESVR